MTHLLSAFPLPVPNGKAGHRRVGAGFLHGDHVEPRALIVGDDGEERRRVMSWFPSGWTVVDGGAPAAAVDRATGEPFGAVVYTAATDSVDLDTWYMALACPGSTVWSSTLASAGRCRTGCAAPTNPAGWRCCSPELASAGLNRGG